MRMTMGRAPAGGAMATGLCLALAAAGCGGDETVGEAASAAKVKAYIAAELDNLEKASEDLIATAPAADADGWNDTADAAAVDAMRMHWKEARVAYERIEGAIAVLFPNYDASTDERYDGFIAEEPDDNLFDGMGVTGVHAIERILWAGHHPAHVVAFESALPGYKEAKFPQTATEAMQFKELLLGRLHSDTEAMRTMFVPLQLDTSTAFRGVIGSLAEQLEKVTLAATGEEESRYAQYTLADMRANLAGGKATYQAFRDWLRTKNGGDALDTDILAGFGRIEALYGTTSGDALPPVPDTFDATAPSAADLDTPYGRIFAGVSAESDATKPASLVARMLAAADLLGIPRLPE